MIAAPGQAIGRCCNEVDLEVAKGFAGQFAEAADWFEGPNKRLGPERVWLGFARRESLAARKCRRRASLYQKCTSCRTDLYFSDHREWEGAGRLMAAIGIRTVDRNGDAAWHKIDSQQAR